MLSKENSWANENLSQESSDLMFLSGSFYSMHHTTNVNYGLAHILQRKCKSVLSLN